jgi:hypothetical protein
MAYTEQELIGALRKAHAAGDTRAAQAIARKIQSVRSAPKSAEDLAPGVSTNPTDGMSGGARFAAGVGKSLRDTGLGLVQFAASGGPAAAWLDAMRDAQPQTVRDVVAGERQRNPLDIAGRVEDWATDSINENRQADRALTDTQGGFWGNVAGTAAQVVGPGIGLRFAARVPQAAPAASTLGRLASGMLPQTIKGNALQGAAFGAVQPVGEGDSRGLNTLLGTAAGGAGAALAPAVGGLARLVAAPLRQTGRTGVDRRVAQVLRSEAEKPQTLLTPQPSAIPGVQRTLAEETLDPGLARLERLVRGQSQGFDQLDRANNAARVSALRKFAGDESTLAAAEQARSDAATPALLRATNNTLDDALASIKSGADYMVPGAGSVRKTGDDYVLTTQDGAVTLSEESLKGLLRASGSNARVNIAPLLGSIDKMRQSYTGNPAMQKALEQVAAQIRASEGKLAYLENARQFTGNLISGTADGSMVKLPDLIGAKEALTKAMRETSPDFARYLDAWQQGSVPINRQQIGQMLIGSKGGSQVLDPVTGEQVLLPASFSRMARDLDAVAQQATGFSRAEASRSLQPEDFGTIRAVQDDLERRAFAATAGSGGNSHTFERGVLQDRVLPQMARKIPLLGPAIEELDRMGQSRLRERLAVVLANPAQAREILAAIPAQERRAIELAISRAGGAAGAVVVPAQE